MAKSEMLKEVWLFMKAHKAYWLAPIIVIILLFGALLAFVESSAVAPFIYTLF